MKRNLQIATTVLSLIVTVVQLVRLLRSEE
jgi:hypothetical protein